MTNQGSILKSRDIADKGLSSQSYDFFPVVMYACESWTIKKADHQRIDASEPWCWRRLLRVPWAARRSNQSILKEMSPEYSLEGLMLKLKLQYFGHLMRRTDSSEKTLMLGRIEGRRRRGWQRMRRLNGITDSIDLSLSKLRELLREGSLAYCSPWDHKESDMTEQLNWTYVCVSGAKLLQLYPTLYDCMHHQAPCSWNSPGKNPLEWVAMLSSRSLFDPGINPMSLMSLALSGGFFTTLGLIYVNWNYLLIFISLELQ